MVVLHTFTPPHTDMHRFFKNTLQYYCSVLLFCVHLHKVDLDSTLNINLMQRWWFVALDNDDTNRFARDIANPPDSQCFTLDDDIANPRIGFRQWQWHKFTCEITSLPSNTAATLSRGGVTGWDRQCWLLADREKKPHQTKQTSTTRIKKKTERHRINENERNRWPLLLFKVHRGWPPICRFACRRWCPIPGTGSGSAELQAVSRETAVRSCSSK